MIEDIRDYFFNENIISSGCRLNVDFLGEKPTEFALEPLPTNPIIEKYIDGSSLRQFQFQLLSCNAYGADVMQNISNSSFYETLSETIEAKNKAKNLPDIDGIQTIECLNSGAVLDTTTNTARYSIQMRITYIKRGV